MSGGITERNKRGTLGRIRHAVRHPDRLYTYWRRLLRDAGLRLKHRDHVSYYRAVMADDSSRSPNSAVGSGSRERWMALGAMQFDYLKGHGLRPQDRLLEIGCGNLRAGWRFIDYLDPGNYYGVDISPDIIIAGQETLVEFELQNKLPRFVVVRDLKLEFLPEGFFSVAHAHSVFSHTPIEIIEECLSNIGRVLQPGGYFDFTFNRTTGTEYQVLREDFYYRTETLLALAERCGLRGEFMADWEDRPHRQSKIRVFKPQVK